MSSLEFLVDSPLNYWKKCQENHSIHLSRTDGRAVAQISKCIHGGSIYDRFEDSFCDNNGAPSREGIDSIGRNWILESYCSRLRNFRLLMGCFGKD